MSHGQPRRPQNPVKYGDIFSVFGDLARRPVAKEDAAMMQTAETTVFGQTQKGGPAAVMQSAADHNKKAGLVGHRDVTDIAGDEGVTVIETAVPGARVVTESVGGQIVGQYTQARPLAQTVAASVVQKGAITIGEALEATAQTDGEKPVDQSDAAAIQAAEVRATGTNFITPGGLAASAQSAAARKEAANREEEKIKLKEVISSATAKLPADKAVTRLDAEGVMSAELRNNPNVATHPGGVADSIAAAARLNENVNA
ncbi:late embryogenesis abundant protein D-34-like [Mangifera indica]|uniref:late embryogenesis abundant protein D-34-like n=1 Tax=Mangifera indica TaxID=29780 RepID=UPI001CFC2E0B|nr:late embryogenesis abundant protein D-34-like [Mangifera indica]